MKAIDRIVSRESQIRYKKVGRKYIQDNDPYACEGLRQGFWLIQVKDGSTSRMEAIYPARSELVAAAKEKEDELVDIIRKASEARPKSTPLSEQAKRDWDWFVSRNGKEFNTLEYPSIQENAKKIIEAILK